MKQVGIAIIFFASLCCAQEGGDFQPSSTNVWAAQYPRVDESGRVQIRVKAPDASNVRVNFWSGPKLAMEKQQDGFARAVRTLFSTISSRRRAANR